MPQKYDWLPDSAPIASATQPRPPQLRPARWLMPMIVILAISTVALFGLLLMVLSANADASTVTIIIDGDAFPARARGSTVADVLASLNIDSESGDLIQPPPITAIQPDMIIRIDRARSVMLSVDGDVRLLWTPLTNPAELLASEGILVGDSDVIVIDGTPATLNDLASWPIPVAAVAVRHMLPIYVEIEGEEVPRQIMTTHETVGDALYDAGITLYLSDSISVDLNTLVQRDMTIRVTRARPVSIVVDGETVRARAQGSTVANALADAGVALNGLDYAIPDVTTRLLAGMSIRVIRVREEIETLDTTLSYESLIQADPALEIDQQRLIQAGREGLQRTRTRIRYENGFAIERETELSEIIVEPMDEIVGYGTNVVIRTVDTPEGALAYWRVLRMYATSYHPAALGGDNVTATGATLQRGVVGANPTLLPYRTQIYVPGYGTGSIEDTGGARSSPYWVDLGYSDADWVSWSRYVDVYLLAPPPADIDYLLPNWTAMRGRPDN